MNTPDEEPTFFRLYVGEQHFRTTVEILCEGTGDGSTYFRDLLESPVGQNWLRAAKKSGTDPSYSLELDPDIFTLILSYLRSGVMPLYWNELEGFDYRTYAQLEKMAEFLGVERLRAWIAEKKYLRAVKYTYKVNREVISRSDDFCRISQGSIDENSSSMPWSITLGAHVKCDIYPVGRSGWMGEPDEDMAVMTVTKETVVDNKVLFDEDDYMLERLFT